MTRIKAIVTCLLFFCITLLMTSCAALFPPVPGTREVGSSTLPIALLWRVNLQGYVTQTPLLTDNTAIVVTSQRLYGLDSQSGKELWHYELQYNQSYVPMAAVDGALFFGEEDGAVTAVNLNTGEVIWNKQVGQYLGSSIHSIDTDNERIFVVAQPTVIQALDIQDGTVQWQLGLDDYPFLDRGVGIALYAEHVYIIDQQTYILEPKSGGLQKIIDVDLRGLQLEDDLILSENDVRTLDDQNAVSNLVPTSKKVLDDECDDFDLPYTLHKNLIFGAGNCGGIYAMESQTGKIKWEYLSNQTGSPPMVLFQKALYALLFNGEIHAISLDSGENLGVLKTNGPLLPWGFGPTLTSRGIATNGKVLVVTFNEPTVLGLGPASK